MKTSKEKNMKKILTEVLYALMYVYGEKKGKGIFKALLKYIVN